MTIVVLSDVAQRSKKLFPRCPLQKPPSTYQRDRRDAVTSERFEYRVGCGWREAAEAMVHGHARRRRAWLHRLLPQSSSASRLIAGATGFLILSQCSTRPER
jgi:hypothetical protein